MLGHKTPCLELLSYVDFCLFKPNYNMTWHQRWTGIEGSTDSLYFSPSMSTLTKFLFLPLFTCCFFNRPEDRWLILACSNGKDTDSGANIYSSNLGEAVRRQDTFMVLATCDKLAPYRKKKGNGHTDVLKSLNSRNAFLSSCCSKYQLHFAVVWNSI